MSQQQPDPTRSSRKRVAVQSKTSPDTTSKPPHKLPAWPAPDDQEGWKAYWKERQQPWRTEPEIDGARQQDLAKYAAMQPDIEQGIYPFRGMKLSRADIEWLLTTYQDRFTPEKGLDVRGADLNGVNLSWLPLRGLRGGLSFDEWSSASEEQRKAAAVQMNSTLLHDVQLARANLREAHLQGADLSKAQMEDAYFYKAQMKGANLREAHLQGADLSEAQMEGVDLYKASLQDADLSGAQLQDANFYRAQLQGVDLYKAQLEHADLNRAQLDHVALGRATLADLQGIGPKLADVRWDGVNLAVVDWSQIKILGNEGTAQQKRDQKGGVKKKELRLREHQEAVRANRQLAVALQGQGLNEEAARFAYRANMLQRKVLWFQMRQTGMSLWQRVRKLGAWMFSHLLNLLAGYGYKPERSFLAYLLIVFGFMGFYLITSQFVAPHLSWDEALVLSLSSFHGRGFFTQTLPLGDPYARLAVGEAVLGLFVEVSLIATFTQRFFGK